MKKAVVIGFSVGVLGAAAQVAHAQQSIIDDDANSPYGWDYGDEQPAASNNGDTGPHSLLEAKQQHRGYRIGTGNGMHTPIHGASGGAEIHVVEQGDTLWDISDHYFGDPWHWPELWSFNPEITNPHWIYPLDQIRLSPNALAGEAMVAKMQQGGGGPGGLEEKAPSAGVLAGTETAASVVVPRSAFTPGTVFLREQGYLDNEALRTAGQISGGNEEQMFLSPSDQVYLKFKNDENVQAGQAYTIFRDIKPEDRNDEQEGVLVRILGTAVVRSYDRDKRTARAVVTEALEPIERGMFVAKMDRRFDLVAPKRNESNVVAKIVASIEPHVLVGFGDVVFLDVGEGHGIQPGNRFFVVRRGDGWLESITVDPKDVGNSQEVPEYDPTKLPKEVVAELRVLKVRKKTTICLVVRSDIDLAMGDRAEMRVGF
jgi:hypothetical protein